MQMWKLAVIHAISHKMYHQYASDSLMRVEVALSLGIVQLLLVSTTNT